jgi:hypothetical protein
MRLFNRRDAMHAEKTKAPNLCVHRVSAVERALRKFARDETISRDSDRLKICATTREEWSFSDSRIFL